MRLVNTIVDTQRKLIGFILEGKETEFGGFTDNTVIKPVQLVELARTGFRNNQIAMKDGKFTEVGKFKVNELPMKVLVNNGFVDINSEVNLTSRYVQGNDTVGFGVAFADGSTDKYNYKTLIQLCRWFKPGNFVIRVQDNGSAFVAGKAGYLKIEQLPIIYIGAQPVKDTKIKSAKAESPKVIENNLTAERDIMDLYDLVRKHDGVIINLPDEKYKANGNGDRVADSAFTSLGIGEVGSPYLSFGDSKLNANTVFKKIGNVQVEIDMNTVLPVNTYTFNTKSVFFNGENHIKRFGIAISREGAEAIVNLFGDTLGIKPITDEMVIKPITALILNGKKADFIEVNTNKIALLAPNKVKSCLLSVEQIFELQNAMVVPKLTSKYLSDRTGLLADLKKKLPREEFAEAANKEPLNLFKLLGPVIAQKIEDAGIDIYSGAFKRTVGLPKEADTVSEKQADTAISIEYALDTVNYTKLTYSVISSKDSKLPKEIIDLVSKFEALEDDAVKYRLAKTLLDEADNRLEDIKRKLWLHKCAMYMQGNKAQIHCHDKDCWEVNTKKRTKATVYNCTKPGLENLCLAVNNITL